MAQVFIHIPKTGGFSIRQHPKVKSYVHHTAKTVRQMHPDFDKAFKFTFVRNPYDRFLSAYMYYYQMTPTHMFWHLEADRLVAQAIKRYTKFQHFVIDFHEFEWRNRIHFLPQYEWLYDGEICLVDYIARFENYKTEWHNICKMCDIGYTPLPKLNTSNHADWSTYYTPYLKNIVYEIFEKDFELFGYDR